MKEFKQFQEKYNAVDSASHSGVEKRDLVMSKGIQLSKSKSFFNHIKKGEYLEIDSPKLSENHKKLLENTKLSAIYKDLKGDVFLIDKYGIGKDTSFAYKKLDLNKIRQNVTFTNNKVNKNEKGQVKYISEDNKSYVRDRVCK